ncbi:MAG: ABC transporter permease [Oscillospiraceae bacterium]|nr:ABC transporter permease [Oscillospiraceae bacterium]
MRSKKRTLSKNAIILIVVNMLLTTAVIICFLISASFKNMLRSQQAAKAWAGQSGEHFSQISVFLPQGSGFSEYMIRSIRENVEKALVEASISTTDDRRLYTDAWSATGTVNVVGNTGTTAAQVFAVGGDYFLFHPLYLRDGSYFSPNDLMKDRVLLDEELAWRLFGSVYLEGLQVSINNIPYYIAGVVSRESDFASEKAYTGSAAIYMSYEALSEINGGSAEIISYEIVMPNPISGFAMNIMTNNFSSRETIVENSERYALSRIFDTIKSYGQRSMRIDGQVLPYWENAAIVIEDWLALLMILTIVCAVFPIICTLVYGRKLIIYLVKLCISIIKRKIDEKHDRKAEEYRIANMEKLIIPGIEAIVREVQEEREIRNPQ